MSQAAKTLMGWIKNSNSRVADNDADRRYCLKCAYSWAALIIAGEYSE